jgi:uncharacterized protein (TIGR04222 family)
MNWTTLSGVLPLVLFGVCALFMLWLKLRYAKARGLADVSLRELIGRPYSIACLRRGEGEALRTALIGITDRGLSSFHVDRSSGEVAFTPSTNHAAESCVDPLDRAILRAMPGAPTERLMQLDLGVQVALDAIWLALHERGLVKSAVPRAVLQQIESRGLVILALLGIAVVVASPPFGIPRFVVLSACTLIVLGLLYLLSRAQTRRGTRALKALRSLCSALPSRMALATRSIDTHDAVLAAAVFGTGILPGRPYPLAVLWRRLERRREKQESRSSCGGCGGGSSCGSHGSGDGSGCGGGCGS